jgi:hypothetical protein
MPESDRKDRKPASTAIQPTRLVNQAPRPESTRRDTHPSVPETEASELPELPEHEPTGERGGRYGDGWW